MRSTSLRGLRPAPHAAAVLAATLLVACATSDPTPHGPPARPPRLVVQLIVDGLPMRQVTDHRAQLAPDGLARFLNRGTWFAQAHYGQSNTVTAIGHSVIATGAYPHKSGIIGNEWRSPETGQDMYCTADPAHSYIGHATKPLDGTSPKNLTVETVGDVLRRANPASKVIGISGKDRGAILPAGHAGTAYMYMSGSGQFASTTYYMAQHPRWVDEFNAARRADAYFKTTWKPLLDDSAYSEPAAAPPWMHEPPGTLPMVMDGAQGNGKDRPDAKFYASLLPSPYVDAMSLDFARAAVAAEQLGQDDAPDLLSISLSGHDYVNHRWTAESRISHDHLLQLDRLLQAFFAELDRSVGAGNYVAVLTADHGFTPAPEYSRSIGVDAGRVRPADAMARINAALEQKFGVPKLARFFSTYALSLDRTLIAQHRLVFDDVAEAARGAMLAEPIFLAAYTRRELQQRSRVGAPYFEQMARSWHAARSGDIQYVLKPNWLLSSSTTGTTHGSPHRDDTHVPILMWGPAWLGAARVDQRVEVSDIAPTLSRLLGVAAPAASEGRPLPLAPVR